ncbi:hypothetical protein EV213_101334 [Aureibacillus halotolerans]|uniref:Uncharacterized protein n=1 Tax=Aureibacillus halotolerans TaxID=1508390 RepID=A0A4R6UIB2_9BACI|nr:hypothetical protein EV213_101334 [Aureibacillus halotolerans]
MIDIFSLYSNHSKIMIELPKQVPFGFYGLARFPSRVFFRREEVKPMEFLIIFLFIEIARALIREGCAFLFQWLKRLLKKRRHKKNRPLRPRKLKGGSKTKL